MRWALGGSAVLFAAMMLVIVAAVAMFGSQNCGTGSPSSPTAPPEGTQTEGQVVRYLESQGFSSFGAAGIVGNLEQESTLNPADTGGGLAQWEPHLVQRNVDMGNRARPLANQHGRATRVPDL